MNDSLHSSIHDAFSPDCFQALIELACLDVRVVGLGLSHPGGCQLPTLRVTAFPRALLCISMILLTTSPDKDAEDCASLSLHCC